MTEILLESVTEGMKSIGVPYQYEIYYADGKLPDIYAVGHVSGSPVTEESGMMSGTFLLTLVGTSWTELEKANQKIRKAFPAVSGYTKSSDDSLVLLFYDSALSVPCDDGKIKKIQINLKYKEWNV